MLEKDRDFVQDVIEKESNFHSNSTLDNFLTVNIDIPTSRALTSVFRMKSLTSHLQKIHAKSNFLAFQGITSNLFARLLIPNHAGFLYVYQFHRKSR